MSLEGIYSKDIKYLSEKYLQPIFTSVLFTANKHEISLNVYPWMTKEVLLHIYLLEYYSAIKKDHIFQKTWI